MSDPVTQTDGTIAGATFQLDGSQLRNVTIIGCTLEISGEMAGDTNIEECRFVGCRLVVVGAAARTVLMLRALSDADDEQVRELIFGDPLLFGWSPEDMMR